MLSMYRLPLVRVLRAPILKASLAILLSAVFLPSAQAAAHGPSSNPETIFDSYFNAALQDFIR